VQLRLETYVIWQEAGGTNDISLGLYVQTCLNVQHCSITCRMQDECAAPLETYLYSTGLHSQRLPITSRMQDKWASQV
jgi:hypothetical protein